MKTPFNYRLLGLEPRDMLVYETLHALEKGSLRAIAETTGLNRGTVYEVIKKLTTLGLVNYAQAGQQKRYRAADPAMFGSLIRERRDQLSQAEEGANAYTEAFRTQQQTTSTTPYASFYEGDEGLATVLRDVLSTCRKLPVREYHVYSTRNVSTFLYHNFPTFSRQRFTEKIAVKVITTGSRSSEPLELAERKYLSGHTAEPRSYQIVYGNKTALISLSEENVPFAIVLESSQVADMQRLIFNQLWTAL